MRPATQRPLPAGPVDGESVLRATTPADLAVIATLHRTSLGHGLYPRLGRRFLRRYHEALLASPHTACRAAGPPGRPSGFIVTVLDPPAHRAWLRGSAAVRLAIAGLIGLLTHPGALLLFLRTRLVRYARALLGRTTASASAEDVPAVLLHVVVSRAARGQGLGAALCANSLTEAAAAGRSRVALVTQAGSPAEQFYQRLGWTRNGERAGRDGTRVVAFEHPTESTAP